MSTTSTDRRQGVNVGAAVKVPVRAATTANITLSGEQTIDGVACVSGDRVLVKNQTAGADNGIYDVDTGNWSRSKDFDGAFNVVYGTMVRVNEGSQHADGFFVVATSGELIIGTTSLSFSRLNINNATHSVVPASAGQTLVTTPTYQIGANGLSVFVNGQRVIVGEDYTETSSTSITFTTALSLGDEVDMYAGLSVGNLTAASASAVTVDDAGDFYSGNTVEAVLQEIRDAITEDNGDADATLAYGSSTPVQRWNSALTANRTATLSTANAKEGAHFVVVRAAGATGNFHLAVGSLDTLRAPGEWAEVRYDAGTAAWILEKRGFLPSAGVKAVGDDVGDADATLTVGSSAETHRWATTLTADRTATLSTGEAWAGARFRIDRQETASGNFALAVVASSVTLIRLPAGQWCDVEYTGTEWIVTARGELRQGFSSTISLHDDFLGEEIEGTSWQSVIGSNASCLQALVLADQIGGQARLTTGAGAGATMAVNGVQLQSRLNWRASQGCLACEFRVQMDAITSVCVFLGLTDQVSALEMPFTLAAGDALTSNASDAVGVLFDTAADTDNWWLVGVAADVDAAKQNTGVAPVASTMETWRIEISAAGVASFYRNGTLIGTAMAAAVTASASLTPVVAAFARTNASRNIDVDFASVRASR